MPYISETELSNLHQVIEKKERTAAVFDFKITREKPSFAFDALLAMAED